MTGRLQSANAVTYVRSLTPIRNGFCCLSPHTATLAGGRQDRLAATDTGSRRVTFGADLAGALGFRHKDRPARVGQEHKAAVPRPMCGTQATRGCGYVRL